MEKKSNAGQTKRRLAMKRTNSLIGKDLCDSTLYRIPLELDEQRIVADYLRVRSWEIVTGNHSGHLGGTSSSVEIFTALYFGGFLNMDLHNNANINRDIVIVRGHLGPLRYGIFNLLGWIDDDEMYSYRGLGSRLQGHEKMGTITGIDITPSGALGLILSYGVGSALNARVEGLSHQTYVFIGDGEEQEGNISEAARHAASMKLDNLVCVIDKNNKQLSRPVKDVDASDIELIWRGYGWEVFTVEDGHDLNDVNAVYAKALTSTSCKPKAIIAKTIKGKGLPDVDKSPNGYHTISSLGKYSLYDIVKSAKAPDQKKVKELIVGSIEPVSKGMSTSAVDKQIFRMDYQPGMAIEDELSRFFERCAGLMERNRPVYLLTADLIPKNEVEKLGLNQSRFVDVGIREQHMFAMAHGMSISNHDARIVIKSHDAFLYRAADQIQAINIGGGRVIAFGDYGGLSGCYNGETHESTSQLGTLLSMSNAIIFEPGDTVDFWKAVNYAMVENPGLVYIRLYSRESKTLPRIDGYDWFYRTHEPKQVPKIILVSAGMTANDTLMAGKDLEKKGMPARVINIARLSGLACPEFAELFKADVPVLTVYNGEPYILKSVVSAAIMSYSCSGQSVVYGHGFRCGESGTIDGLKALYGLDPTGIIKKVNDIFF